MRILALRYGVQVFDAPEATALGRFSGLAASAPRDPVGGAKELSAACASWV
jgi:hypothetical protein